MDPVLSFQRCSNQAFQILQFYIHRAGRVEVMESKKRHWRNAMPSISPNLKKCTNVNSSFGGPAEMQIVRNQRSKDAAFLQMGIIIGDMHLPPLAETPDRAVLTKPPRTRGAPRYFQLMRYKNLIDRKGSFWSMWLLSLMDQKDFLLPPTPKC
jgi:hypothetical protein